jgi:hypothetical protein
MTAKETPASVQCQILMKQRSRNQEWFYYVAIQTGKEKPMQRQINLNVGVAIWT